MNVEELKKAAKENHYEFSVEEDWLDRSILLKRVVYKDLENFIIISLSKEHHLHCANVTCDMDYLNMLAAAVEFTKIPIKDR